jgi:hypothetical protein
MSNELATTGTPNAFEQYAAAMSTSFEGRLLKFDRFGEWLNGKDAEKMKAGTRLIAHIDHLEVGWLRWEDGRPAERRMGLLAEGFVAPKREELDHLDESQWPTGNDGKKKDPWVFTNLLQLTEQSTHMPACS